MKDFYLFRILILAAFWGALQVDGHAQSEAPPAKIRVLCYNIHWCLGTDGKYDVKRIAEVIKKEKPDLVALQEIDIGVERSGRVHQAQLLSELTGMEVRLGPTQAYQGGLFGNAVLSRFPIRDVEIHPLPYTEATESLVTYPRGCIIVTVEPSPNQSVRFISTHFQHNVAADRVEQAKAINLLTQNDKGIPTILAGDMNATPDSEPITILLEQWKNATNEPAAPTVPVKAPTKRIDYIFYRPENALKLGKTYVIPEVLASDHRPVFAEFELTPVPKSH